MEPETEAKKIVESVKSGNIVKSITDIRLDKMEQQFSQIEKLNNDLIAANKELYAFVANNYSQEKPAEQMKASADMSSHQQNTLAGQSHERTHLYASEGNGSAVTYQPSIGVVTPPTAPTDEPSVNNVMKLMGYPTTSPDGQ